MKSTKIISSTIVAIVLLLQFQIHAATALIYGEAMLNPSFENNSYEGWIFDGSWRNDGNASRMVYDLLSNGGNAHAYSLATGIGKNGMEIAAENNIDASSSYLQGFNLTESTPYLAQFGDGSIDGKYNLYFEVTIECASGEAFRAQSEWVDVVNYTTEGPLTLSWEWISNDVYQGDVAEQNDSKGIQLDNVDSITYTAVLWAEIPNQTENTHYITIDNMNLQYEINASPIPEPSSLAFYMCGACGLWLIVRRRSLTNRGL